MSDDIVERAKEAARIKELEADVWRLQSARKSDMETCMICSHQINSRIESYCEIEEYQSEYIERLEAAFLSAIEDAGLNPRQAREALERIRRGEKDD